MFSLLFSLHDSITHHSIRPNHMHFLHGHFICDTTVILSSEAGCVDVNEVHRSFLGKLLKYADFFHADVTLTIIQNLNSGKSDTYITFTCVKNSDNGNDKHTAFTIDRKKPFKPDYNQKFEIITAPNKMK